LSEMARHADKTDGKSDKKVAMTASKLQKTMLEKIIENLDLIHKRGK